MSKKGVTLIELIIVVIILILLAVIALYNANRPLEMAQLMAYNEECGALYVALANLLNQYNMGHVELTQGEYYTSKYLDSDGAYVYYLPRRR